MIKIEEKPKSITHVKVVTPHSPFSGDKTYATLFLMYAFDLNVDRPVYNYFVNCYIDDFGLKHHFNRPLFVLLRTRVVDKYFFAVDSLMKDNKNFVYSYPVGSNYEDYLFMYVYECPGKYEEDYNKFLKGEYSKFSVEYKKKFGKLVPYLGRAVESPIYGVLHKTSTVKDKVETIIGEKLDKGSEYFSIPVLEYEIFRFNS